MDEIARAVRWQDAAPPYGAGDLSVWGGHGPRATLVDTALLSDSYTFVPGSHWDSSIIGTTQTQSAPARVVRGLPELPEVIPSGAPPAELANASRGPSLASAVPYVVASRHANGAVAVATLGRMDASALWYFPLANVSIRVDNAPPAPVLPGPFGIFGHYSALTLGFSEDVRAGGALRLLARDLLGGAPADITSSVVIGAGGLAVTIPGAVIDAIGTAQRTPGDASDPGLLLELVH